MKTAAARFPSFDDVARLCESFTLVDFNREDRVKEYAAAFNLAALCKPLEEDKQASGNSALVRSVSTSESKPYTVKYDDLCRLHWLCLTRKVVNVLEFGSGYSTGVLADAMSILSHYFADWAEQNSRAEKPFHVFSVDEDARFVDITRRRLAGSHGAFATLQHSAVELTTCQGHFATLYNQLPNVAPDLIYLDGPSQFATDAAIDGFTIANPARMPMSADILRFEFFLEPGTLLIIDGRTANARFLKAHLKRAWAYHHDAAGDVHLFELQEPPLGKLNQKKLEFCLGNRWLLK